MGRSATTTRIQAPRHQPDRHLGVDLARGVAVVAMIVAHVRVWARPATDSAVVDGVLGQLNNLASPLFGLVMGVSVALVLSRPAWVAADAPTLVLRHLARGVLLVLLGQWLGSLETFVAIVLQVLGVVLAVGTPIALLPRRALAVVAFVLFLVAPFVNAAARDVLPVSMVTGSGWLDRLVQWAVLDVHYRLTNLLPFFLAGAAMARSGLSPRLAWSVLGLGLVGYAGWGTATALGHESTVSGSALDSLGDVGLSFTALGLCLVVGHEASARPVRVLLTPVAAAGTLALTVYVVHVLEIWGISRTWPQAAYARWPLASGGVLVITVAAAWAWWRWVGKGPVEVLMGWVTGGYRLR